MESQQTITKYAIIIPDGAADDPLPELGDKTPLEAARIPQMDWIAQHGVQGTARTVPEGFESGSDVATMSLLKSTMDSICCLLLMTSSL